MVSPVSLFLFLANRFIQMCIRDRVIIGFSTAQIAEYGGNPIE